MANIIEKPDLGEFSPNQFFDLEKAPFDIDEHCVYSVYSGSTAYGTNLPTSDLDIRGVVIEPQRFITGLGNFEQAENQSKDVCFFGIKKLFTLAYKSNCHALELLWIDDKFVKLLRKPFNLVLDNRDLFMSRNIGYSFGGYAYSQLKILKTKTINKTGRISNILADAEYDYKFAAHAIRLFRSGAEALQTGTLQVYRPDREELKEIRLGKYTYNEFIQWDKGELVGGIAFDEQQKFNKAFEKTELPKLPNFKKIEELLMEVYRKTPWLT